MAPGLHEVWESRIRIRSFLKHKQQRGRSKAGIALCRYDLPGIAHSIVSCAAGLEALCRLLRQKGLAAGERHASNEARL